MKFAFAATVDERVGVEDFLDPGGAGFADAGDEKKFFMAKILELGEEGLESREHNCFQLIS